MHTMYTATENHVNQLTWQTPFRAPDNEQPYEGKLLQRTSLQVCASCDELSVKSADTGAVQFAYTRAPPNCNSLQQNHSIVTIQIAI